MSRYTIQEQAARRRDLPPLASSDPNLVREIDFRDQTAALAALTAEGLTAIGTVGNAVWDTTKGLNPNGAVGWRSNDWSPANLAARSNMYENGGITIYFEIERRAIASTYQDLTASFIDNADGPTINDAADFNPGTPAYRQLFDFEDGDASPYPTLQAFCQMTWSGSNPLFRFVPSKIIDTAADQVAIMAHPAVPSQFDSEFMEYALVLDYKNRRVDCYLDGYLRNSTTWDTTFGESATDICKRFVLFARYAGNSYWKGFVRRMQIINRPCYNRQPSGHRIAAIGDSITVRSGGGYNDEAAINTAGTAAAVLDANYNKDNGYAFLETGGAYNPVMNQYYMPWLTALANLAAYEGAPFHYVYAGDSGSEWSDEHSDQIAQNRFDAVVQWNPQGIICMGSVNDVDALSTTAILEAKIKAKLDIPIEEIPDLEWILWLTTPPLIGDDNTNTAAKRALAVEHRAMMLSSLQGYRGFVTVFDFYEALGGDNAPDNLNGGSHELVALWDTFASGSNAGNDIHPAQTGMSLYAQVLWPVVKSLMYRRTKYGTALRDENGKKLFDENGEVLYA